MMTGMRNTFPIVKIYWEDAHSNSIWMDTHQFEQWIDEDGIVVSVGILINKDKNWIVIGQTMDYGAVADGLKIPTGMVKKITRIGNVSLRDLDVAVKTIKRKKKCHNKSTSRSCAVMSLRSRRKSQPTSITSRSRKGSKQSR